MDTDSILLPLIPLRGITIFPNMIIHFDIGKRKGAIASLEEAMLQEGKIFLVTQKDPEVELPNEKEDMYSIGTICKIKQILKLPKGTTRVLVEGIERATLLEFEEKDNHLRGVIEKISESEKDVETNEDLAFRNQLGKAFAAYIHVTEGDDSKVLQMMEQEKNLGKVTDLIAAYIQLEDEKKQLILETINVHERIEKLLVFIDEEIQIIQIEKEIGNKVKTKLDKSNKEYFLREQIKAIQEELGEDEEKREINKYTEQLKKLKMPKEVREKAEYELSRLKSSNSSDGNSIRSYLDWVVALPWSKTTKDSFDIEKASTILDEEHYGLEEVKRKNLRIFSSKAIY